MTLKITGINHVQITFPPDLENACKRFYGEILGLCEVEKPEPLRSRGGAWYDLGGIQLHASREEGADGASSKRHVCYMVTDLDAAKSHFEGFGIAIEDEATEPNGLKRFFVRDPAGNKVEIGWIDANL